MSFIILYAEDYKLVAEAVGEARARRLAQVRMGTGFSLPKAVREFEAKFIERALNDAEGSVTRAAETLGISYQALAYLLKTRHQNLLSARKPPLRRQRRIIRD